MKPAITKTDRNEAIPSDLDAIFLSNKWKKNMLSGDIQSAEDFIKEDKLQYEESQKYRFLFSPICVIDPITQVTRTNFLSKK